MKMFWYEGGNAQEVHGWILELHSENGFIGYFFGETKEEATRKAGL